MPDHEELMARARAGVIEREFAHRERVRALVAAFEAQIQRWVEETPAIGVLGGYEIGMFGGTYSMTLAPRSKWYGRARERWWLLLWALKHPRGMWREWRDR